MKAVLILNLESVPGTSIEDSTLQGCALAATLNLAYVRIPFNGQVIVCYRTGKAMRIPKDCKGRYTWDGNLHGDYKKMKWEFIPPLKDTEL